MAACAAGHLGAAVSIKVDSANWAAGENAILQWSECNHSKDNYPKPRSGTWDDLADKCSKPAFRPDKDGLALCASIFKVKVRRDENAIETFFFAFDLDDLPEDTDASDILASVPGLLAFTYTSHSHLMPGKGARFRLVVAINKRIPADQVRQILAAFAAKYLGRFGTAIDSKCFNPSRIFFYPSCAADRAHLFEFARQEGAAFDWESLAAPPATDSASASHPEHLNRLFDGKSNLLPASMKPIVEGNRNDDLFKCASAMRGQGMEQDEIAGELLRLNLERCKPPLPTGEVLDIAASVARYVAGERKQESLPASKSPTPPGKDIASLSGVTELVMAEMIAEAYGGQFHYVPEFGKFYVVEEHTGVWMEDYSGKIQRWFFELLRQGKEMAFELIRARQDSGSRLLSAIQKAEKQHFIAGSMTLMKALIKVTVRQEVFDANPYMVGLQDGMCIDLKSGEVRRITPSDYITKTLGTHYSPGADCPKWKESLRDWTRKDADLARFLQVLIGYSLAGLTEVQQFFFLYGAGQNGKSVFVAIISTLLGDYSKTIGSDSLMEKRGGEATNDLARLPGARAVFAPEVPEGRLWNEERVKALSGGDKISARFLYAEYFEFICTAVLFVTGNHKPIVRGNDFGFWRRMLLIPFLALVEKPDPGLTNRLMNELPGILNWALEGWRIYQSEGLVVPECVKLESAAYREEMDVVGQWLDQRTAPKPGNKLKTSDVYSNFKDWAIANGFHVPNSSSFGRKLEGRITKARDGNGRYYCDISLTYQ